MTTLKELSAAVAALTAEVETIKDNGASIGGVRALELDVESLMDSVDALTALDPSTVTARAEAERIRDLCRAPFPPEQIGKLPKKSCKDCGGTYDPCRKHEMVWNCALCGNHHSSGFIHLDYVGHAEITARLAAIDPVWEWWPLSIDPENGLPMMVKHGGDMTMWIKLTVGGVTRLGVGSVSASAFDVEKQLIGDALRNAAMRFGIGLELWSKSENLDQMIDAGNEPTPTETKSADAMKPTSPAAAARGAATAPVAAPAAVAPEPAQEPAQGQPAAAPAGGSERESLARIFMGVPPKVTVKVKKALEAEGLWPIASIPDGRVGDAFVIVEETVALHS